MKRTIYNGIPWYDQNGNTVNAHGACIVQEGETYYLFGEYKTNDVNQYRGFSCYSTNNFTDWKFEGFALPPLKDGALGPGRIGERVKVLKSKRTGRYSMLMHTDDDRYCDPCIGLAVGERLNEEFAFQGPLLFQGEPIRFWDMGTFVDDDGTAYLLTHEGNIYRLDETCTEAVELTAQNIAPGGESPAMFKKDGIYYLMISNKTSWERNDNYYFTAKDLHGPWQYRGCSVRREAVHTILSVPSYSNMTGQVGACRFMWETAGHFPGRLRRQRWCFCLLRPRTGKCGLGSICQCGVRIIWRARC